MNNYVTGSMIRRLREEKRLTQEELASRIFVSNNAVSKWETGQGFPDISLLEPLADALGVSVIELLSGEAVRNQDRAFNMLRTRFYVCPVCGNVIHATGEAVISCCGITLPPIVPEAPDADHTFHLSVVEDEYFVTLSHPMTKTHFLSFLAAVSDQGIQLVRLYPEGNAEARFKISRVKLLYACCNRHGLFQFNPRRPGRESEH